MRKHSQAEDDMEEGRDEQRHIWTGQEGQPNSILHIAIPYPQQHWPACSLLLPPYKLLSKSPSICQVVGYRPAEGYGSTELYHRIWVL